MRLLDFIIVVIITFGVYLPFTCFVFGLLPNIKARNLTSTEKIKLIKEGITHCTIKKNADKIIEMGVFIASRRIKSYSNLFKKSTYFFVTSDVNNENINFNCCVEKDTVLIKVTKLTQQQIDDFKIRRIDNALVYTGNFKINCSNKIEIKNIGDKKSNIFMILLNKRSYIFMFTCVAAVTSFVVYVPYLIIRFLLLN